MNLCMLFFFRISIIFHSPPGFQPSKSKINICFYRFGLIPSRRCLHTFHTPMPPLPLPDPWGAGFEIGYLKFCGVGRYRKSGGGGGGVRRLSFIHEFFFSIPPPPLFQNRITKHLFFGGGILPRGMDQGVRSTKKCEGRKDWRRDYFVVG